MARDYETRDALQVVATARVAVSPRNSGAATSIQNRVPRHRGVLAAKLREMLVVARFDSAYSIHSRNIRAGERAIVHDLFDTRAG